MPAARSTSETELAQRRALRQFGVGDEDIYAHRGLPGRPRTLLQPGVIPRRGQEARHLVVPKLDRLRMRGPGRA